MMAAPAFDTKFVRPVLRSIVLYLSIILVPLLTMVRPAQAEGTVNPSVTYWGGSNNIGFNCNGMASVSAIQDCEIAKRKKWLADDHDQYVRWGASNIVSCPAPVLNDYGPAGNYADRFSVTYYRIAYNCGYGYYCNYLTFCQMQPVVNYYIYTKPACPANATTATPPCTCKAGFEPDSAGTSCVPVDTCPVPALKPLPEDAACAQVLENISAIQAQKDAACGALTDKLKTGMACFRDKLAGISPAIPLKITSDVRDVAYQEHLRDIWDNMQALVKLMKNDPDMQTACATRRAEIAAEKGCDNAGPCTSCYDESATQRSHCLIGRPANPNLNDAQHTLGNAFDVSRYVTINPLQAALGARNPPQTISQFLDAPTNCNLNWGGTFTDNYDPIHFYAH